MPGTTPLLTSGAVLDESDRIALVEAALDLRIAAGVNSRRFERNFARYFGLRKAHLTNSGSSANLVALKKIDSWSQGDFVEKGGWATVPGSKSPEQVSAVAKACALLLAGV